MKKTCPDTTDLYDVAIVGAGAAGYMAAVYASRYTLKSIVIGSQVGGQTAEAHLVQNFPTYTEIPGFELMQKFRDHVASYNVPILYDTVTKIDGTFCNFKLTLASGTEIKAQTILIAIGQKRRKLNIRDEERLYGKGITYCTTCDGPFYKDKVVGVIGGSDSANTSSLYLAEVAQKVYQIYRGKELRGEPIWAKKVLSNPKIEVLFNTQIASLNGADRLESVTLDTPYKGANELRLDGLFVEIGCEPDTTLPGQLEVELNDDCLIKVKKDQSTNIEGIWAAGDITDASNNFHQTITAASEGAIAAHSIFSALKMKEG